MSLVARLVLLVVIWVLAWGEVTLTTVLVGAVLAALLLVAFPPTSGPGPIGSGLRPWAAVRLILYMTGQLVVSNVLVAREILGRGSRISTGVIEYELHSSSEWVATLVANLIALTPGTMTVEATRDPPVLHVHFLLLRDVGAARRSLARLERLVLATGGHEPRAIRSVEPGEPS
jgi:multisubunit Na+/H+ antiporter MnhE subunit